MTSLLRICPSIYRKSLIQWIVYAILSQSPLAGPNGKKIADVSVEDFDRVYGINLRGSFNVTKHAVWRRFAPST